MKKYDYLLVGGGLFSAVFAYHAVKPVWCLKKDRTWAAIYTVKMSRA